MKNLLLLLVILVVSGCATAPDRSAIQNAYFGQKPNEQEKIGIITEYVKRNLIDPESLRLIDSAR